MERRLSFDPMQNASWILSTKHRGHTYWIRYRPGGATLAQQAIMDLYESGKITKRKAEWLFEQLEMQRQEMVR